MFHIFWGHMRETKINSLVMGDLLCSRSHLINIHVYWNITHQNVTHQILIYTYSWLHKRKIALKEHQRLDFRKVFPSVPHIKLYCMSWEKLEYSLWFKTCIKCLGWSRNHEGFGTTWGHENIWWQMFQFLAELIPLNTLNKIYRNIS